jgi:hypothetical protein
MFFMLKNIKIPWLVIICALFVFVFTNLFSYFIFDHTPHVPDEIEYVFQAKIFKSGRLYAPSPCEKEFFDFAHMINNGKWYSQYTPGHPLLLLLGLLIHAPWLINPFLAALSIILFYLLGKEIFNNQIGVLAAVLGAISIWFLLMSSTMLSHTSCLFFTSLFLLFFFRSIKKPSVLNGLFAGIGLGMAFLIRPFSAVLISIPFLIYFVFVLLKDLRKRIKNALVLALAIFAFISVLLIYNQITNGHPLRMGYIVSHGEEHSIGFGRTGYTDIPHTPFLGSTKIGESMLAINKYLFGWPLSSFLAILPLLWIARMRPDYRKKDLLLAAGFISLTVGLYFYWGIQIFIGARMYFETIPILLLLSAHGISEIPQLVSSKWKKFDRLKVKKVTAGILIIFTVYAFSVSFPRWIWPPDNEWNYFTFAKNLCRTSPNINNTLKQLPLGKSVVIMKFLYFPFEFEPHKWWWGSGFQYNDPQLKGNIIYAHNRDNENIRLFDCFPERNFFLYLGTLNKGMLIPLKKEENQLIYGKPICSDKHGKKYIELIDNPKKLFTIYSSGFEDFLDNIYKQNRPFEINVAYLIKMANLSLEQGKYDEASYYLEAALQLEKRPKIRMPLLTLLSRCYFKTGMYAEAKKIMKNISDFKNPKLYRIFPEKGF